MRLRLREIPSVERRIPDRTRFCQAPGCTAATRGAKPYCLDHVDLNPQARRVLSALERGAHSR